MCGPREIGTAPPLGPSVVESFTRFVPRGGVPGRASWTRRQVLGRAVPKNLRTEVTPASLS